MLRFEKVSESHIDHVAKYMRNNDAIEVKLSHGVNPLIALKYSCAISSVKLSLIADEPIAIFGLAKGTILDGYGSPWLLGTDDLSKYPKSMVKLGRLGINEFLKYCNYLENYVHVDNFQSIKWLQCLNFKFDTPKKHGPYNALFMRFYRGYEYV